MRPPNAVTQRLVHVERRRDAERFRDSAAAIAERGGRRGQDAFVQAVGQQHAIDGGTPKRVGDGAVCLRRSRDRPRRRRGRGATARPATAGEQPAVFSFRCNLIARSAAIRIDAACARKPLGDRQRDAVPGRSVGGRRG